MPVIRWLSTASATSSRCCPPGLVRGKLSVIGNGVVVDPHHFVAEVEKLRAQGIAVTPTCCASPKTPR